MIVMKINKIFITVTDYLYKMLINVICHSMSLVICCSNAYSFV